MDASCYETAFIHYIFINSVASTRHEWASLRFAMFCITSVLYFADGSFRVVYVNVTYCLRLQLLFRMADFTHTATAIDTKRVQLDTGAKFKVTTGTEHTSTAFKYYHCRFKLHVIRRERAIFSA